jgi:hypothetical protein
MNFNMIYQNKASHFASTSHSGRRSRQSQSYHSPRPAPRDPLQINNHSSTPSQAVKYKTSSIRLPREISVNMISLISKFEALDALSLPVKIPSLQPTPLRLSRDSFRRKGGTGASQQKNLSTIFSPRSCSRNRYRSVYSEEDFNSAGEDILWKSTLTTGGFSGDKLELGRIRKPNSPHKIGSIRLHGRVRNTSLHSPSKPSAAVASSYIQTEPIRSKHGNTVRDMIRFYDGSTDHFVDPDTSVTHISSFAHVGFLAAVPRSINTKAKPSVASQLPVTPLFRRLNNDVKPPSLRCTANSKQTFTSSKSKTPVTPTKLKQLSVSKKRNLEFGPTIPNPFLAQDPPTRCSTTTISLLASSNSWTKSDGWLDRGRPLLQRDTTVKHRQISISTKADPFRHDQEGSSAARRPTTRGKPLSTNQRSISDKIEDFYRARSLERKHENSCEISARQHLASVAGLKIDAVAPLNVAGKIQESKGSDRKNSKVAKLKRLFDSAHTTRPSNSEEPGAGVTISGTIKTTTGREVKQSPSAPQLPPPPSPLLPQFQTKSSVISGGMGLKSLPTTTKSLSTTVGQEKILQPTPARSSSPRTKSKVIGDKVNMFEWIGEIEREIELRVNDGRLSKGIGESMIGTRKTLFDRPLLGQASGGISTNEARELTELEVKEFVDEFHDTHIIGNPGKSNTAIGRWNTVIPPELMAGGLRPVKENGAGADANQEMVVKEAQCGLKEPKPLRIVEMRRLMLICRERAGANAEKKKEKAVYSRKL